MKKTMLTLGGLFCVAFLSAQEYQKTDHGIRTTVNGVDVELQYFSPTVVRVVKTPAGKRVDKQSLAVVAKPGEVSFKASAKNGSIVLDSKGVDVSINASSGVLAFSVDGKELLHELQTGEMFTPFDDAGTPTFKVYQPFELEKDEAIYGLGQWQNGQMSQRNVWKKMIQANVEDFSPFFQSTKGYGLYWDNYSPTIFKDNEKEASFRSDVGDCMDYYVMYGGDADGVVAQVRYLTGDVPMFPLWTYGYWQSKAQYESQDEVVGVVRKYRDLGVPLDGIIQDWQYWGHNYLWNAMDFTNPKYPNPQKMLDDVHAMNAHMAISVWSSFGPATKPYRELAAKGLLYDFQTWPQSGFPNWPPNMEYPSGVRVYDAYSPEARDIYWKYLNDGIFKYGMDAWWMDSTEPDHLDFKPSDLDQKTVMGTFRRVRNAYPLMTVGGVYDHQRAATSDKRVFILTRSGYIGQQRYGANVWTGDVTANWRNLRAQVPAGLNFSLSGMPHWNCDIGGFFARDYNKTWNDGSATKNSMYQELYVRWLQFGTFTPMMRSHGSSTPREIYKFGRKGEPVYDAIEKMIRLRYSLLPYIYSTSWDVSHRRSTFMRALVMDFNGDSNVYDIKDQWMFGPSLMACPVGYYKARSRQVYLPRQRGWYDFYTGRHYAGGQTVTADAPYERIPVYVPEGSIIPFGPEMEWSDQHQAELINLYVYTGTDAEFTLYEDENTNYNYERGQYATITFKYDDSKGTLTITDRKGSFDGMLTTRRFNVVAVSPDKVQPLDLDTSQGTMVEYSGKAVTVKVDK